MSTRLRYFATFGTAICSPVRRRIKGIAVLAIGFLTVSVALLLVSALHAGPALGRPRILGIKAVRIHVSNLDAARQFYKQPIGTESKCDNCQVHQPTNFFFAAQFIALEPNGKTLNKNNLLEVDFETDDLKRMEAYLHSRGIKVRSEKAEGKVQLIRMEDPEGHQIGFVTPASFDETIVGGTYRRSPDADMQSRLIHAGWVVKDRAAMDKFYRDVLGFHLYWQGGMKDDRVDWVSMQVPDGTDWIEYMLNIPTDADKHLLGVMNHIALGVPSVREAAEQLKKNGMKLTEEPKIGRDGKWQLNLYDPDDTRVELMEFTPVEKPCCSEFRGAHPKP